VQISGLNPFEDPHLAGKGTNRTDPRCRLPYQVTAFSDAFCDAIYVVTQAHRTASQCAGRYRFKERPQAPRSMGMVQWRVLFRHDSETPPGLALGPEGGMGEEPEGRHWLSWKPP
jgi:hypothetical protein